MVTAAALAFAVAAAAMTLPELVAGRSLGKGDRQTTLFGSEPRDAGHAAPTSTGETAPESETETETTPTDPTETTSTDAETAPAPQHPEYQSETPPAAPSAQSTKARPTPTETGPDSAQQP